MGGVIEDVRAELEQAADSTVREGAGRYFKEGITLYGVRTPLVNRLSRTAFARVKASSKDEVFTLCEELFRSGFQEEAYIAADWAYRVRKRYEPGDFAVFERWVESYVDNWAKCDTLCNHAVGAFLEAYPDCLPRLKAWTASENRWVRRAAAVSLVVPARRGEFLDDVFDIAGRLLTDPDDLVRKGYGWLLKEAGRLHQAEVFAFVMRHREVMPRTSLRYAVEKMPEELRREAMARPPAS